jgi:hypothetical protein
MSCQVSTQFEQSQLDLAVAALETDERSEELLGRVQAHVFVEDGPSHLKHAREIVVSEKGFR